MTKRQNEAQAAFPRTQQTGAQMINGHDLCRAYKEDTGKARVVYLWYRAQQTGRGYQCAAWQVIGLGFKTDPNAHWRDHGSKTFNCFSPREDKARQLEEAKAWAGEKYGITAWKKTNRLRTTGAWFPAEVVDWLETKINEHLTKENAS